ncbi:conserved hypothetical protein [Gluconacetobacter diazotrophicus PA1 5]|nr:hypothetical protein [Gluconacetobacter diazotrophicus]ACI53044.1 conserved hypothetical protein [Gluconacetobacter diazotrophicus PA1 5]MBB2157187.1 hypothetical protein [Gluconacetobacter diazotrophicus]TWB07715.1 hypothetical protein FBZ86_11047 [Gluconacetobacter diazotrophicus]
MASKDEPDEAETTASSVATALIRIYGAVAIGTIRRHISRCVEDNLTDEAEFWLRVRNRATVLLRTSRWKSDTIH